MGMQTERQRLAAVSPSPATVIFVLLGYAAFLIAGYVALPSEPDHNLRVLPLYAYAGLLLLALQWPMARGRSSFRNVYVFLTSAFAIIYAADAMFGGGKFLLDQPATYFVLNILAFVVFFYDAVARYRSQSRTEQNLQGRVIILAGNAASFAVLCALSCLLLNQPWVQAPPWNVLPKIILVDPHEPLFGTALNLSWLALADAVLAVASTIIAGLSVISVAAQLGLTIGREGGKALAQMMGQLITQAVDEGTRSLALVLNPFIWLIPAFLTGAFAQNITADLIRAGAPTRALDHAHIWELFNPFGNTGQTFLGPNGALADVAFAFFSVVAVIAAVTWAEHNWGAIVQTLRNLQRGGFAIGLSFGGLLIVLALTNYLVILIRQPLPQITPFRVGPDALVAIAVVVVLIVASFIGLSQSATTPAGREPAGTKAA